MSTLFSKLRTVTLAYSNNLLDKTIDMNSIPVVKQYIRDLEDAMDKTNHEVAVASANLKILQQQIDTTSHTIDLDKQRATIYLQKNDQTSARAVASRIHDNQVLLDSYKDQISQATQTEQAMQTALEQMTTKHGEAMTQMRKLESEDNSARSLDSANTALKGISALTSNDVMGSVDNVAQKIHQHNMVVNEEFQRTVQQFAEPADPLKDAAVDDILASLQPPKQPVAQVAELAHA